MLNVSEEYKTLTYSNLRPKCEPLIKLSGKDVNGNQINLTWSAQHIQKLSFKRSIDPVGRELPYMELTWTEVYTGNLNVENYPEKYNNIVRYMAIDLEFHQKLNFSGVTNDATEVLKMPRMFLVAKPVLSGQTITWTARDLLFFLEGAQAKGFEKNVPYRNALRWFLLDERANFKNSAEIFMALQNTQSNLLKNTTDSLNKNVVVDGNTKQVLIGLGNIKNYYWDFAGNIASLNSLGNLIDTMSWKPVETVYDFTSNVMYDYPVLTANPSLSAYSFKQYVCELDEANKYTLSPFEKITVKGTDFYHFAYKGLGKPVGTQTTQEIGKSTYSDTNTLEVIPANLNGIESSIQKAFKGDVFVEDNTCNPYNSNDSEITNRAEFLSSYFLGSYSAEVMSLPNLALETGDFVTVETNLFNGENRIKKTAVVLRIEIEYSGAIKQKTVLHTG